MAGMYNGSSAFFSSDYLGDHWHPQRVQRGQDHFDLRQVRTVILAVPKLKQTIFGHLPIPTGGCAVNAHTAWLQIVDPDGALVQRRLKFCPTRIVTQQIETDRQPIITEIQVANRLIQTTTQGLNPFGRPVLYSVQSVVRFRQNVAQPPGDRLAQADPLPVAMGHKVRINQFGHAHMILGGDQYWNIVYSFCGYVKFFIHTVSLAIFRISSKFERTESFLP